MSPERASLNKLPEPHSRGVIFWSVCFKSKYLQRKRERKRVLDSAHAVAPGLCSTVERLSLANETMALPPKKEEKKVKSREILFFVVLTRGICFNDLSTF